MTMTQVFLKEMQQEAVTTRKMLSRVPNDKFDWKPHPKSMNMRSLATHIADLPSWTSMAIHTSELDFEANPYNPPVITDAQELLNYFESNLQKAIDDLEKVKDAALEADWTLRNGEKVLYVASKMDVIRMSFCQTVHHRAQLGVYLRLLDIPIPGSYGPSADEQ
ncbi:MAG: DinB family protein [Bacteroidota bacterium]|nr:DinB family protein [Bacteroidota bacterium]